MSMLVSTRRLILVSALGLWSSASAVLIARTEPLAAKSAIIAIWEALGGGLFLYSIAHATWQNLVVRTAGAVAGLLVLAQASNSISSGACRGDGLCGTKMLSGILVDVTVTTIGFAAVYRGNAAPPK